MGRGGMASTRDQVLRRPEIRPDEVDDIVAIASELQDAERERAAAPSAAEVEAVARELDIDPSYVDAAVQEHRRRKDAAAKAATDAAAAARTRNFGLLAAAGGLASLAFGALVIAAGWGWLASSSIQAARIEEHRTEGALITALDRQQALAPQLVALAGGSFTPPAAPPPGAPIEVRLQASERLGTALAEALSVLPPSSDPAMGQQRLNLQYELTGTQNRISVERQRWQQAHAGVELADRGVGATLAHGFGFVR